MRENPECYICGEKSEATDHIEPHVGREDVFERFANHIALCHKCHNTVTAKFDMKYRPGDDISPKVKWMNEERARHEILRGRSLLRPKALRYEK